MKRNIVFDVMKKAYPTAAQILVVALLLGTGYVAYNLGTASAPKAASVVAAPSDVVYTCSMHPQIRQSEPGDCPICGMELVPADDAPDPVAQAQAAPLGYACSMNCLPPLEEPGKCPVCGMEMQPVSADLDAGHGDGALRRMTMTPEARALLRVETSAVERRPAIRSIRLNGALAVDPGRRVHISANVGGRVDRLHARFVGARIEQGAELVSLYSPELLAVQRELLQALAAVDRLPETASENVREAGRSAVAATRERLRLSGLSDASIEAIVESREATENITLHAPMGGTVVDRPVEEGEYVGREARLLSIADLGVLWAEMDAFESDLPWLSVGAQATFTTRSRPGEEFLGTVSYIDPVMQSETRTARVRIDVENPDQVLMPGMYVAAVVESALPGEPPLIIPSTAPLLTGRRAVVYVEVPDTDRPTFEGREVALGARTADGFIVESGLNEGERVVTHGAFQIDSSLQIIARPSMMNPEKGVVPASHADHGSGPKATEGEPQPERLIPTLNAYLRIQTGLGSDDLAAAQSGAALLERAGHANNRHELARIAARIVAASDIKEARAAFYEASNVMIPLVQHHGNATGALLRRAHCPMALDWKGAEWIQGQDDIFNPYFGAEMLECGTFEEEFPSQ